MIIGFLSDGCATHEMAFLMAVYLNIMLVIFIRSTFSNPSVYYMAKSMWTGFVYFCLQLRGILMRQHAVIIPAFKTYLHVKPEKVNKGKVIHIRCDTAHMKWVFCFVLFWSLVLNLSGLHGAITSAPPNTFGGNWNTDRIRANAQHQCPVSLIRVGGSLSHVLSINTSVKSKKTRSVSH